MENPTSMLTRFHQLLLDNQTIVRFQDAGVPGHQGFSFEFSYGIRQLHSTQPRSSPGSQVPYVQMVK